MATDVIPESPEQMPWYMEPEAPELQLDRVFASINSGIGQIGSRVSTTHQAWEQLRAALKFANADDALTLLKAIEAHLAPVFRGLEDFATTAMRAAQTIHQREAAKKRQANKLPIEQILAGR